DGPRAPGPPCLSFSHRAREPRGGAERPRALEPGARARALPPAARARRQPSQQALGRRAADAGHRARPHEQSRPPPPRRAHGGAGSAPRARSGTGDRRAQARGAVHPPRGAEPRPRSLRGRPHPHPEPRPDRPLRPPHGTPAPPRWSCGAIWVWPGGPARSPSGTSFSFQPPPGHRHDDIIRRELEQIEWSEELGFDEAWLTEHHFIDYGLSVDPASLAAAAASRTRRIRIGLAAAILPFHHPLRLAAHMA